MADFITLTGQKNCLTCAHGKSFKPRPDERYSVGCHLPGFEGYEDPDRPSCFGKSYAPALAKSGASS